MTYQWTNPDSAVHILHIIRSRTGLESRLGSPQPLFQPQCDLDINPLAQRTFPDDRDSPASLKQVVSVSSVPFRVGVELGLPELRASSRGCRIRATGMPVPETAVNEAYCSELTKHEIGSTGKFPVMQAVSQATGMKGSAESKFRPRVPAADSSHHARTGSLVHYVRHCQSCQVFRGYNQERLLREVPSWHQYPRTKNGNSVSEMGHETVGKYGFIRFSNLGWSSFQAISVSSRRRGGKP